MCRAAALRVRSLFEEKRVVVSFKIRFVYAESVSALCSNVNRRPALSLPSRRHSTVTEFTSDLTASKGPSAFVCFSVLTDESLRTLTFGFGLSKSLWTVRGSFPSAIAMRPFANDHLWLRLNISLRAESDSSISLGHRSFARTRSTTRWIIDSSSSLIGADRDARRCSSIDADAISRSPIFDRTSSFSASIPSGRARTLAAPTRITRCGERMKNQTAAERSTA